MSCASFKKRAWENEVEELENKLKSLEREHKVTKDSASLNELKQTCMALDKLLTERVERSLLFTEQKYYDNGPKSLEAPDL